MKSIVVLICLPLALSLSSCLDDTCHNSIIREVPSLDSQSKAVVFQRDCGATTGFSTQVSILSAQAALPNDGGNIFVADTNHGAAPSGQGGGPDVLISWLSATRLKIVYDHRDRTFNKQTQHQGISIIYQTR